MFVKKKVKNKIKKVSKALKKLVTHTLNKLRL